ISTSSEEASKPYLFLFTFSPVQEFIKAARKFLDFWAGSYLLHYFSALLCFEVAKEYGPDAIITPSLWNQEIIDAFILQDESLIISTLKEQYNNPAEIFIITLKLKVSARQVFRMLSLFYFPIRKQSKNWGKS
ncbi:MAG: hypothetical protein HC903_14910, partial [Methylacidiphilales bacterium]|nr:hypothetical protein [Candidatus Methylacidiphilales bacterium]